MLAGFTLVEFLVVIAIVGTMMGLATLSLKGVSSGVALSGEGNRISTLITLARQNAMSKNTPTALVLSTDPSLDVRLRAMSIWEATPRNDGSLPVAADWKQISKWETLKTGVVFAPPSGTQMDLPTVSSNPPFPALTFEGQSIAADGFVCKIFLPAGGLLTALPGIVTLAEGVVPAGATSPVYTNTNADGTPANTYTITVVAATGHMVVERL